MNFCLASSTDFPSHAPPFTTIIGPRVTPDGLVFCMTSFTSMRKAWYRKGGRYTGAWSARFACQNKGQQELPRIGRRYPWGMGVGGGGANNRRPSQELVEPRIGRRYPWATVYQFYAGQGQELVDATLEHFLPYRATTVRTLRMCASLYSSDDVPPPFVMKSADQTAVE